MIITHITRCTRWTDGGQRATRSPGARAPNRETLALCYYKIHVYHTSLIRRIRSVKIHHEIREKKETRGTREILEDNKGKKKEKKKKNRRGEHRDGFGCLAPWKTTPHTSAARRFRLPIKGVFPFDAPPRLTFFLLSFLFFFFFPLVSLFCPFLRLLSSSSSFHFRVFVRERGCRVFDVSVKGERDVGSCLAVCHTSL